LITAKFFSARAELKRASAVFSMFSKVTMFVVLATALSKAAHIAAEPSKEMTSA
jgi:hypothetical protein